MNDRTVHVLNESQMIERILFPNSNKNVSPGLSECYGWFVTKIKRRLALETNDAHHLKF